MTIHITQEQTAWIFRNSDPLGEPERERSEIPIDAAPLDYRRAALFDFSGEEFYDAAISLTDFLHGCDEPIPNADSVGHDLFVWGGLENGFEAFRTLRTLNGVYETEAETEAHFKTFDRLVTPDDVPLIDVMHVAEKSGWRPPRKVSKALDWLRGEASRAFHNEKSRRRIDEENRAEIAELVKQGYRLGPRGYERAEETTVSGPVTQTAASLRAKEFPAVDFVVPAFLPTGLTILAGRPKVGKSWLALDIGLAVASGGSVLGMPIEQGDTLYLALEDSERRLRSRISKLFGPFNEWPQRLEYATEWPQQHEGGCDRIREWAERVERPRLVIVDVLQRFRAPASRSDGAYANDYAAISGLQSIASEKNLAVVVVHHLRKSGAESDPFEKVSGTLGLSGAADTVLILDRDAGGTTLYVRGRDIEEAEHAVEFDRATCRWRAQGRADQVRQSGERKQILDVLIEAARPMAPGEIASAINRPAQNVRFLIFKMVRDGQVIRDSRGRYTPSNTANVANALTPLTPLIPPPPY